MVNRSSSHTEALLTPSARVALSRACSNRSKSARAASPMEVSSHPSRRRRHATWVAHLLLPFRLAFMTATGAPPPTFFRLSAGPSAPPRSINSKPGSATPTWFSGPTCNLLPGMTLVARRKPLKPVLRRPASPCRASISYLNAAKLPNLSSKPRTRQNLRVISGWPRPSDDPHRHLLDRDLLFGTP